ncbi:MAG: 5-formyltetrahydrofolate cyclo-ligase [Deltaproteobacteria bacterium]
MKANIRREMIARRNLISREEIMEKSTVIQKRVLKLPIYQESKTIGLYASFNNEVSTSVIFDRAVEDGKKVLFPCIRKADGELAFFPVRGLDELELGPFGIMAPFIRAGMGDCLSEADLLLIPGVSYDLKGGRIGYGGGFYDRTLHKLAKLPFIVALAYEFQILDEVPMCAHDIRVDVIVTEKRVIVC